MTWRLGCDLGTNSLGWCALRLENGRPTGILAMGARIFNDGRDPKSKESLAVDRRTARSMRRRRDRFVQRQEALLKHLAQDGLFPATPEETKALQELDPYRLRATALSEKIPLHHLGRALFHLNQRRGFKSNRKTDRRAGDDAGKIAVGVDRLRDAIAISGARTYGEFLHLRRCAASDANTIPSVRARLRPESGEGAKGDGYDFYPGRALIEEEFEALWQAQHTYYPEILTQDVHDRLYEIIFNQRKLKAPRIGTCTMITGEQRLAKAHPLFQRRRLLEEINALMITLPGEEPKRLTLAQRDLLLLKLQDKRKVGFASLRKTLRLPEESRFNKEHEHRTDMPGDEVTAELGGKTRFGPLWHHFSWERQWEIVQKLKDEEDPTALRRWLEEQFSTLSDEQKTAIVTARLPEGYGRFGQTATLKLIEALREDVRVYSEAVAAAGLGHHSDRRTGEIFTDKKGRIALPYYGLALEQHIMPGTADPNDPEELAIGRLTNPTVHIGLNQLRRVVNSLIRAHGLPEEICIELARDLKFTEERKKELTAQNAKNQKEAIRRGEKLREIGQADTGANRALLRLWEELNSDVLDRRCIYTGRHISIDMLFNGSVEVDHILPFATTLDDSNDNKILCLREANRFKRKRSPYEAWGNTPDWDGIAQRAAHLPRGKQWRFQPNALQQFEESGGFQARQLVDTQYLSKLAHEYLQVLYPEKGVGSRHVRVSPGRLTELVRRKLGLNALLPDHNLAGGADHPKNRLDHRHHAIDAAVVAIIDTALLNEMSRASAQDGAEGRERVIVPEPWPTFRDDLHRAVDRIIVSHRPDHGSTGKSGLKPGEDQTAGKLHNDTAYGLTGQKDAKGNEQVVHRVPLSSLEPKDLPLIRDPLLRHGLENFTRGQTDKKAFEIRLRDFSRLGPLPYRGIRRLRLLETLKVIPVRDAQGRAYKGYKGDSNNRYEVWELPNGKWVSEVISMFQAHQPDYQSPIRATYPTARKILRLRQNDLLAVEQEAGARQLMRVVKFSMNGALFLSPPHEGGALKARDADKDDPFKYLNTSASGLKKLKARQVRIDEVGRVCDPGFPPRTARRKTRKP